MKRVRCKARKKVAKEMDFVSMAQSRKSVKAATKEALKKVEEENEVRWNCIVFMVVCELVLCCFILSRKYERSFITSSY